MNAQFLSIDIRGIICEKLGVWDPIPFAEVWAIPLLEKEEDGEASPGRLAQQISPDELRRLAEDSGAAVHGRTDEKGHLEAPVRQAAAAWSVYVCIRAIATPAGEKPVTELKNPVCYFVGSHRPGRDGIVAWIPARVYCRLKRRVDAWTIAGRLTVCGTDKVIGGATVTAFDADGVQHDNLGSDVTDAAGLFRIDYPGSAFRAGTWLDIELFGGPDVYFRVEDSGGNPLIEEGPVDGRMPGRHDRGPCFCVELCAKLPDDGGGDGEPSPNAWVSVGSAHVIPDSVGLNGFDADGYAGPAGKFALFQTPVMRGYVARKTSAGNPIEYRFLVSDTTAPNGGPPVPEAAFTRVVDASGINPLFVGVTLGSLVRLSPLTIVPVGCGAGDLKPGGWLNVNEVVENAFAAVPAFAGLTLGVDVLWGRNDALLGVNTTALTTEASVPAGAANAGQPVPAGDQIALEKFAFRFEIREVDATTGTPLGFLPAHGTTLNSAFVNNNPAFLKLGLASGLPCEQQSGSVSLAYTAYHPHIGSVSLNVKSGSGLYDNDQSDATPPNGILPLSNTNPARVQVFNPSLALSPAITEKCGYIATLGVVRRLSTGDSTDPGVNVQIPFCYF